MKRLIKSNSDNIQKANSFLANYDEDTIDFVEKYLYETTNLIVVEIRGDDFVEVPNDEVKKKIRNNYLQMGIGEGFFDTRGEFDRLCEALQLVNPDRYKD